jgi:anti-sigma regulatory factor (Ser/Thr protein kinase)
MNDGTVWSRDIDLDDQPASASQARAFVRRHLVEHGLAYLSEDVELVVSELATNAMVHAQTAFRVSLYAFEETLLLEVEDGSQSGPVQGHADTLDPHGRGLTIVDLVCRDWGMDALPDGGKSVWAEFTLAERRSAGRRATA